MQQMATAINFGAKVNLIRYEEAEEVGGTVVKLAGWGATTVLELRKT
jgi:hypothetical protein